MMTAQPTLLVADDNEDDRRFIERYLRERYKLVCATSIDEARACLDQQHIDVAMIDVYLEPTDQFALGAELLEDERYEYVPMILMSGKPRERVDRTFTNEWERRRFIFLDKNEYFDSARPEQFVREVERFVNSLYSLDLAFHFRGPVRSWEGLADKFSPAGATSQEKAELAHEMQFLARKAFAEWDAPDSPVRATALHVCDILESGDASVVAQVRPYMAGGSAQADVILKTARVESATAGDHKKFSQYKNVVGGYGLRERRYARTRNFHGQIYAIPYYELGDTSTFFAHYFASGGGEAELKKIEGLTRYLFEDALGAFNQRAVSGQVRLSDYYAARIKLEKRAKCVQDLIAQGPPFGIQNCVEGDQLKVRVGGEIRLLPNPLGPVLLERRYKAVDDLAETALRHGDMHPANVLVDARKTCCWFIDYESFGVQHYFLADHVEFEANVLCSLLPLADFDLLAQFTDAISDPRSLRHMEDIAERCDDEADAAHLRKAYRAIREIRRSADRINGTNSPRSYYHALMYEVLRMAGKVSHDSLVLQRPTVVRRWHALITAAQLFEKIEQME
jgi:CheY-like chemotaxis protein